MYPDRLLTLAELRSAKDTDLIAIYDKFAELGAGVEPEYYLTELARRDAARQADRMEALTRTMARLTWVITALTALSVLLSGFALIIALGS